MFPAILIWIAILTLIPTPTAGHWLPNNENYALCNFWKWLNPRWRSDCQPSGGTSMDFLCNKDNHDGDWHDVVSEGGQIGDAFIACSAGSINHVVHIQVDGPVFLKRPNLMIRLDLLTKQYFPALDLIYLSSFDELCEDGFSQDCDVRTLFLPDKLEFSEAMEFFGLDSLNLAGQPLPPGILSQPNVRSLSITNNGFNGSMSNFNVMRELKTIIINEDFTGSFPSLIHLNKLVTMLIQGTSLSGTIPAISSTVRKLRLRKNPFLSGEIPGNLGSATGIHDLSLSSNGLTSINGPALGRLTALTRLSIQNNELHTTLPTELLLLSKLAYLDISSNKFSGTIPTLPTTLTTFLASQNDLVGLIPDFPDRVTTIDLTSNSLSGVLTQLFNRSSPFLSLKLGQNKLSGTIPLHNFWENLDQCSVFTINNNQFSGTIPSPRALVDVGTLKGDFDFSWNQFSGKVPSIPVASANYIGNRLTLSYPPFPSSISVDFINEMIGPTSPLPNFVEPFVVLVPQDFDECATDSQDLCVPNATCTDGWNPPLSYTCTCNRGYSVKSTLIADPNKRPCTPDCGDGLFVEGEICDYTVQTVGCTRTCETAEGFQCYSNGTCQNICGDGLIVGREECDPPGFGCSSTCSIISGYECAQFPCTVLKDINECERANRCHSTKQCINTIGSYFCCEDGFVRSEDESKCVDYNECLGGHNCESYSTCINTYGSFHCCQAGFRRDPALPPDVLDAPCVDIDECVENLDNCSTNIQCVNTPGSFYCCEGDTASVNDTCVPCWNEFKPVLVVDPKTGKKLASPFPSLAKYDHDSTTFYWNYCRGPCDNAEQTSIRQSVSSQCFGSAISFSPCYFACPNLTLITNAQLAIDTLKRELARGDFLAQTMMALFGVNLTLEDNVKRGVDPQLSIRISNCSGNATDILGVIQGLARDIVPNAPELRLTAKSCDSFMVTSTDLGTMDVLPPLIAAICGTVVVLFIIAVIVIFYLWIRNRRIHDWSIVPEEVSWGWRNYEKDPSSWDFRGTKKNQYFFKEFPFGGKEFQVVRGWFDSVMKGDGIPISKIEAVYNQTLVSNFLGAKMIMDERFANSAGVFGTQTWRNLDPDPTLRTWVYERYVKRSQEFTWNKGQIIPIWLSLHGTDTHVAEKIVETGFASLSSLDAGYFGRGIYFASYAYYVLPYLRSSHPTIILSWIIPGNVFPVIEPHNAPSSMLGSAIKSGYNSHYVATQKSGETFPSVPGPSTEVYDEIVISQESQIAPAFLVHLDQKAKRNLTKSWLARLGPQEPKRENQSLDASTESFISLDS